MGVVGGAGGDCSAVGSRGFLSSRERALLWDGGWGLCRLVLRSQRSRIDGRVRICSTGPSRWRQCVGRQAERPWGENECRTTMSRYPSLRQGRAQPNSSEFLAAREAGKGPRTEASGRVSDENEWSVCWAGLRRCSACCAWQSPAEPDRAWQGLSVAGPAKRQPDFRCGRGKWPVSPTNAAVFWPDSRSSLVHPPLTSTISIQSIIVQNTNL